MKKISLTTMILLALVLGMIIGVVLNNTASPETAKLYAQEISIFTTIFLRLIKMIIAPLVVSTLLKWEMPKPLVVFFLKHSFYLFAPHCCQLP